MYPRSTAFMESSQDFVGSADVHQSTCQMDMKIKIFKTKITSHIFIFFLGVKIVFVHFCLCENTLLSKLTLYQLLLKNKTYRIRNNNM